MKQPMYSRKKRVKKGGKKGEKRGGRENEGKAVLTYTGNNEANNIPKDIKPPFTLIFFL